MALAPYQATPQQGSRERRRAALLRALGGVAARGPELGTDPFGSFQAGLRGALATNDEQIQQDLAQRVADYRGMEATASYNRSVRENDPNFREYGVRPYWMDPDLIAQDPVLAARAREDALRAPSGRDANPYQDTMDRMNAELAFHKANPGAARYGIGGTNPPPAPRQISPWMQRQVGAWMRQNPGASEDDAIAALTYNRPVLQSTSRQAVDGMGAPLWIGPDGRATDRYAPGLQPLLVELPMNYAPRQESGADAKARMALDHAEQNMANPMSREMVTRVANGLEPGVSQEQVTRARRILQANPVDRFSTVEGERY